MSNAIKIVAKANNVIESFCKEFEATLTITVIKNSFTARMTRNSVQIFSIRGDGLMEIVLSVASKCETIKFNVG